MTPAQEVGVQETAVAFACRGETLVGVLHAPAATQDAPAGTPVLIVAGQPQYRAGSHRMLVLLARELAANGHPTLRFDYRGMGDSDGEAVSFEEAGDDIAAAIDLLTARHGAGAGVVLWGFCDGASAAAFHAGGGDSRVAGLVLVNPWVRSETGLARTRMRQHYRQRLTSGAFWRRLLSGQVDVAGALRGILATARAAASGGGDGGGAAEAAPEQQLPDKVAGAILAFRGRVLLMLSGADETAREFETTVMARPAFRAWRERQDVALHWIEGANHTYSRREWRRQVHDWTLHWLRGREEG